MRQALLALLLLPAAASAQGPIETRNGRAASLAFLRLEPRGALLEPGGRSFGVGFLSANNLKFEGGVRDDQETERLALRFGWGVRRGEWDLEVPLLSRGGGFMDPFINGFHKLVGIDHNFRDTVPYGRSEETLPGSGTFGSESGFGDVKGTYSRPIGPRAFLSFALKLPTGNAGGLLGSGGVDLGAALYSRWRIGPRFEAYGQIGGVFQGAPARLDHARSLVDQDSLAVEYRKDSRDSWVFQWQSEPSALIVGVKDLDGPHRQLSLGYTRRVGGKDSLQLYFNQDGDFLNFRVPALVNIAPDFTIGANFTRRW